MPIVYHSPVDNSEVVICCNGVAKQFFIVSRKLRNARYINHKPDEPVSGNVTCLQIFPHEKFIDDFKRHMLYNHASYFKQEWMEDFMLRHGILTGRFKMQLSVGSVCNAYLVNGCRVQLGEYRDFASATKGYRNMVA